MISQTHAMAQQAHKSSNGVMVDVHNLVKRYGQKTVVDNVSFSVRQGEIFGVLGPNGAGKMTLLETLQFFRSLYSQGLEPKQLLHDVALEGKASAHPQDLSGGQRQRLALALALVNDPKILFLDEPTAALDPQSRRMLWDIVLKLRELGKTILLTTHHMDEAQLLCDRIAIMDNGQIIALDTAAGLIHRLGAQATIDCQLDGKATRIDIEELPGVTMVRQANARYMIYTQQMQSTLIALLTYAQEKGIALTDLQVRTPTLEDVFLDLTGRELRPE